MPDRKPSFLFIVVDQMAAASLGANGNGHVRTPNLDALAAAGANFTRAYCQVMPCTPARATLFTGLTPRGHGCMTNGCALSTDVATMPAALAAAGYRTHACGKLHLQPFSADAVGADGKPRSWESRRLWDDGTITALPTPYYGLQGVDYVGGHVHYSFGDHANELAATHPALRARLNESADNHRWWREELPAEQHYNDWIARKSLRFIDGLAAADSFFLWCSFPDPHFPFAACRDYATRFDPATVPLPPTWQDAEAPCAYLQWIKDSGLSYPPADEADLRHAIAQTYGMIAHIDDCVGQLLAGLAQAGRAADTHVVFVADHGEYLGCHHQQYKGAWPYEELWRVPFIWHDPGAAARGNVGELVTSLDIVPTVLDYAGIDAAALAPAMYDGSDWLGLPGRSLRQYLTAGAALGREGVMLEAELPVPGRPGRQRFWVTDRYKLVLFAGETEGILFDLDTDPHETNNRWHDADYRQVRDQLRVALLDAILPTDPVAPRVVRGA